MATKSETHDPVCRDCKALAIDILSGSTHSNNRWRTIQSKQATLSYANNHLDGTVVTLQRSAECGCQLCRLIGDKVREIEGPTPALFYHIFFWGRIPEKCEVQVTVQNISMFTKHVSEWPPLKSLVFFGRLTSLPTLPELGINDNSTGRGDRPLLSYLPCRYLSPEALHRAIQWLEECQNRHTECSRPQSRLPKRVLDLGRPGESSKSLYTSREARNTHMRHFHTLGENPTG